MTTSGAPAIATSHTTTSPASTSPASTSPASTSPASINPASTNQAPTSPAPAKPASRSQAPRSQDPTSPAPSQDVDQKDTRATNSRAAARRRRLGRAATLLGAVLVTTVCFLVARVAGADFTITDPGAGAGAGAGKVPHTFVALEIANVTAIIGVLGWLTLATLERWTRRSRMIWGTLAVGIVVLSLVPIWIVQATTATRLSLAVLHIVVGIALWPMLQFGPKNGQLRDQ